jgi:hypothetical protein
MARGVAWNGEHHQVARGGNMSEHELEDDRPRRRELACLATGSLTGALLGMLAGYLVLSSRGVPLAIVGAIAGAGAILGGLASALIAPHLSLEEWNPQQHQHSYVGTSSPDDDIS